VGEREDEEESGSRVLVHPSVSIWRKIEGERESSNKKDTKGLAAKKYQTYAGWGVVD
jgi:hypothetical protein